MPRKVQVGDQWVSKRCGTLICLTYVEENYATGTVLRVPVDNINLVVGETYEVSVYRDKGLIPAFEFVSPGAVTKRQAVHRLMLEE